MRKIYTQDQLRKMMITEKHRLINLANGVYALAESGPIELYNVERQIAVCAKLMENAILTMYAFEKAKKK